MDLKKLFDAIANHCYIKVCFLNHVLALTLMFIIVFIQAQKCKIELKISTKKQYMFPNDIVNINVLVKWQAFILLLLLWKHFLFQSPRPSVDGSILDVNTCIT